MFKKGLRYFISKFYQPLLKLYLQKNRHFYYKNLHLIIYPGVFHPGFFFSSKTMLRFIDTLQLKNTSLLELGTGSGILSLYTAKAGAEVKACDISKKAVENCKKNQELNDLNFPVYLSDLFKSVPKQTFDFILVNPPYYKKKVTTEADYAWFCGENAEYFEVFFSELKGFIHKKSEVYMVLFDGIDLTMIESLATTHHYEFNTVYSETNWIERNFVLSIKPKNSQNNQS